ncbi:hypothetical protein [Maridesulfovibrio zosterae]|uniref:hypothetical protein n=1 Tax=Maridesulfovibrio zosterae TaxID=82171 RepID=UPI00041E5B3D|nr:hypothetical protein [Maridesulfovibrio zosterae]
MTQENKIYNKLSYTGRRIIVGLINCAPAFGEPFPFVISTLATTARCSKLSVLRNLKKAQQYGLLERRISRSGHRFGSVITLHKDKCIAFKSCYDADTESGRYEEHATETERYLYTEGSKKAASPAVAGIMLNPQNETDRMFQCLSDQGKRIFGIICDRFTESGQNETGLVIQTIARQAKCSEVTARRVISKAHKAGIFTKKTHDRGSRFGIILTENKPQSTRLRELLKAYPAAPDTDAERCYASVSGPDTYHTCNVTNPETAPERYAVTNAERIHSEAGIPLFSGNMQGSTGCPAPDADRYRQPPILDRQIKNLSFDENSEEERWANRLLSISVDEFQILWACLHREHFGPDQLRQIVKHRISFGETILDIENSLHAAHFELENKTFPKARKGICNYLFATLKNKGTWRRPVGFMTPNEQALANAKREAEVLLEIKNVAKERKKKEEQADTTRKFEAWLKDQNTEELQEIDEACVLPLRTDESKLNWRKTWWRKNLLKNASGGQRE